MYTWLLIKPFYNAGYKTVCCLSGKNGKILAGVHRSKFLLKMKCLEIPSPPVQRNGSWACTSWPISSLERPPVFHGKQGRVMGKPIWVF